MLQHYSSTHYTHFNRPQNNSENQPIYSTSYSVNNLLQQGRPTSHVPPLPSSVLCSNNHKLCSFSDSSMSSIMKFHHQQQQQPEYHGTQYDNVEPSRQQQQQTLTAEEIQSITTPITSTNGKDDSFSNSGDLDDTSSLVNLSRRLRTNLTLAKQRMMMDLKQSTEPNDIAMYTRLESITLNDPPSSSPTTKTLSSPLTKANSPTKSSKLASASSATTKVPRIVTSTIVSKTVGNGRNLFSHHNHHPVQSTKIYNKHRVHKKKPYNSSSSFMELQTNANGFVSVVLRKKSACTSKDSFATLARSFSFNIGDDSDSDDSGSDDDDDDDKNSNDNDKDGGGGGGGDCEHLPGTPAFDLSCEGDTDMGEPTSSSLNPVIPSITPGESATTTATTTTVSESDYTLNPLTWTSTPIGVNTNGQGTGMDWNMNMMEMLSPTLMEDMEYVWQQQGNSFFNENKPMSLEQQPDENAIDSWLQRGGFGYGPLVAATDQELADLLDFD